MANLEELYLHGNDALEKPPGCPVNKHGWMKYESKDEVSAFLRCLALCSGVGDVVPDGAKPGQET